MGLRNALHSFDVDDDDGTGQTMGGHFRFGIQSGMQGKGLVCNTSTLVEVKGALKIERIGVVSDGLLQ